MRKTYLTERQIAEIVKQGNDILKSTDFAKLKAIGKKYGIELIYGKEANFKLWYNKVIEELKALPRDHVFHKDLEYIYSPGFINILNPDYIKAYLKYAKVWETEYMFLLSPKWDELQTFATSYARDFGIDTFGGATIYIKNGGDYYSHISKHGKKFCDPEALKRSGELRKIIDSLFKGMEANEKMHVSNVIMQYASSEMNADEFHNALFAGQ